MQLWGSIHYYTLYAGSRCLVSVTGGRLPTCRHCKLKLRCCAINFFDNSFNKDNLRAINICNFVVSLIGVIK